MAKFDLESNKKAILKARGNIAHAGRIMHITRQAMNMRIERNKDLQKTLEEAREQKIDLYEAEIDKIAFKRKIDNVKLGALKYHLNSQAKHRGYTNKEESEAIDNEPLIINYEERTEKKDDREI